MGPILRAKTLNVRVSSDVLCNSFHSTCQALFDAVGRKDEHNSAYLHNPYANILCSSDAQIYIQVTVQGAIRFLSGKQ